MPYKIEKSNKCGVSKPWAVLKTDGTLMGCHESESGAKDQITALNISESSKAVKDIDFTPPESVRKAAARGLELRKKYGRGGTVVGVARARDLSNGKSVSPRTIMRMVSYFARHEVDKKAEGFSPGEKGYPSAGRVAWCLTGDTDILLADGNTKTIQEIVDNKLDVEVVAYDEKTKKLVNRRIIDWLKLESSIDEFRRLGRERSHVFGISNRTYIDCTEDHPILTLEQGWVKSKDVEVENHSHAVVHDWFDEISEKVLIGTLLGDSTLGISDSGAASASFTHSIKQEQYLLEKARLLSVLGGRDIFYSTAKSGYGKGKDFVRFRTRQSLVMSQIILPLMYTEKRKKIITNDALDCMGAIGLAFFVCDDGSFHGNVEHGISYRLHTENFDLDSVLVFTEWLHKLGVDSKIYKRENCDGYVVYITKKENVFKFAEIISPYIPDCMRYKLPPEFRGQEYLLKTHQPKKEKEYAWCRTVKNIKCSENSHIKRHNRKKYLTRYDLTIEGAHSFVANGIIVHNSLWGGDAGKSWANKIAKQLKSRESSKDMSTKSYGTGLLMSKSGYFDSYTKPESESVFVKGFASVEIEDREGHIVDPLEFNVDTFINTGTLLRDHKYISDAFGNHLAAGKVIGAEPAEIYKSEDKEDGSYFSIKSLRTGDHITDLSAEKHPEIGIGDRGLFVVAEVTNELAKSEVQSGILNAFSWRGWNYQVNEGDRIRLKSVDLSEISLVHQPQNNQSTYVTIKDSDAKMLAEQLRVTKLKFRSNSFKSVEAVSEYLSNRHINPVSIKETADGFVAVLDSQEKYEVSKSVCISGGDCDLIAAPMKEDYQDLYNFVATVAGEEPETLEENGMSEDTTASQDRQSLRFCVVDEAILQKLFPNSARTELVKSATLALEDGEVADVEILEASISEDEIAALLTPQADEPAADSDTPAETEPEAVVEPEVTEPESAQAEAQPNVHEDLIALIKATAEQQAKTDAMLADLLKKDKDNQAVSEMDKLRQELEAAKAELSKLIPDQDDRDERAESTKGVQGEASVGNMFSFLFN